MAGSPFCVSGENEERVSPLEIRFFYSPSLTLKTSVPSEGGA